MTKGPEVCQPGRRTVIALESRLCACRNVETLGVRPNFNDYSPRDIARIHSAQRIYYPTAFYAELLSGAGKQVFPSCSNYACAQDKIKQTALFALTGIAHPRTRVFYGKRQQAGILSHFRFPFVAKMPRGSAMGRGVFLIRGEGQLADYCRQTTVAYIQEYLPADRDVRVVIIGDRPAIAYWRIGPPGDFRHNLAAGGRIDLSPVPQRIIDLACTTARRCGWNDVGIDILTSGGKDFVLEANMKYGRQGFRAAGIDYHHMMENLIDDGII